MSHHPKKSAPFTSSRIYAIFDHCPERRVLPVHAKGLHVFEDLLLAVAVLSQKKNRESLYDHSQLYRGLLKESPLNRQTILPYGGRYGEVALWTPGRSIYNWVLVSDEDVVAARVENSLLNEVVNMGASTMGIR